MSMQRAETEEASRPMRPPTKLLVDLKISGTTTEQFLQMAPVIAYADSCVDQGIDCAVACDDMWVRDAIAAIAGESLLYHPEVRVMQSPALYRALPRQSVIFPLEKLGRESACLSFAAGDFYGGTHLHKDFLWKRDCYASTLGWHLRRLVQVRQSCGRTQRTGGVFLAMNFGTETPQAQAAAELWKGILRWLDQAGEAMTAPRRFLCGDAKRIAMLYAHLPKEDSILEWALAMVNCRLYIGPDCLLSQLAYSMRIPSIVLSELPAKSHIDQHDSGKYADPLHLYCRETKEWSVDYVIARYNELERIFTTEY